MTGARETYDAYRRGDISITEAEARMGGNEAFLDGLALAIFNAVGRQKVTSLLDVGDQAFLDYRAMARAALEYIRG